MIGELFQYTLRNCAVDQATSDALWRDILKKYSGAKRHYHTLSHLDALATILSVVKDQFHSWDSVVFSIAYHDIIYNVLKNNNEEKSADYAAEKLSAIHFPIADINYCRACILATKSHQLNTDHGINLFTDADLAILGSSPDAYIQYARQIRQEYSIYPDFMYHPGRQKVLNHFLQMARIFKSDHFFNLYEKTARTNLALEAVLLTEGKI